MADAVEASRMIPDDMPVSDARTSAFGRSRTCATWSKDQEEPSRRLGSCVKQGGKVARYRQAVDSVPEEFAYLEKCPEQPEASS
jgi:hypothetical protein